MRTRRGGSLWPTPLSGATMVNQYKPGDIVTSSLTRESDFIGVIRAVDPKINKVWVAWAGGAVSQHDPDELHFEPHQSEIVRSRMASRRGKIATSKKAQHLDNVKTLEPLSLREATRAIRDAIISEEEATKQYETIADSTDDILVKGVMQDIADEERIHIGELQELLAMILEDEKSLLEEGAGEVADKASTTASDKTAVTSTDPQFVGNPSAHGMDKPVGGGFSIMQNLVKDQREESKQESEKSQGAPKTAMKSRRAMYWSNPARVYRRTQREIVDDASICPRCKNTMELLPYTKSDRLWSCTSCHFKIPRSSVVAAGMKSRRK